MKKKNYLLIALITFTGFAFGQIGLIRNIGNTREFIKQINNVSASAGNSSTFILPTPSEKNIVGKVNLKTTLKSALKIVGYGSDSSSTFSLSVNPDGNIDGLYTCIKDRKAYKYYTENGNLMVKEVDIESILCINYKKIDTRYKTQNTRQKTQDNRYETLRSGCFGGSS